MEKCYSWMESDMSYEGGQYDMWLCKMGFKIIQGHQCKPDCCGPVYSSNLKYAISLEVTVVPSSHLYSKTTTYYILLLWPHNRLGTDTAPA